MSPDTLLGREYDVDGRRFTVEEIDSARGFKLREGAETTWVSETLWGELVESSLLRDAAPLVRAMPVRTFTRGAV